MASAIEAADAATLTKAYRPKVKQFSSVYKSVCAAQVVFDENSIASGAASAGSYTVTGAAVGDQVFVQPATAIDKILFYGIVSAANTVKVWALNLDNTSAVTTLSAAPTLYITVLNRNPDAFAD